jgi:hypothetical protein
MGLIVWGRVYDPSAEHSSAAFSYHTHDPQHPAVLTAMVCGTTRRSRINSSSHGRLMS